MRLLLPIVIGLLCVAGGPTPAFAAFRAWTGAGPNNLWTTPQNWQGNVAPVTDDVLSFPAGALQMANVNNYPNGTMFRNISFGATYIVSGNRVQISSAITVSGAGITAVFQCDITNGGGSANFMFVGVDPGTFLLTTGTISGALPIQKAGLGTWSVAGTSPNTYAGLTQVNIGTIVLSKPNGVAAVPAGLRIGSSGTPADSVIVRLAADRQIVGPVEIRETGLLDLNNHFDSIGALTIRSGHITTGTGELTLESDVDAFGNGAIIEGRIALGGLPRVFTTHTDIASQTALFLYASISATGGDGGIIKRGVGVLALLAANGYGGVTRVESGVLFVLHAQALGLAAADAGTVVLPDGQLVLGESVNFEPLLLNKGSTTEHALQCSGSGAKTWGGPIHLTGSTGLFTADVCTLRLGSIAGAGELWMTGNVVELAEAGSNYAGDTLVRSGTLRLNGPNRLPDSTVVRLGAAAVLSLAGFNDTVASVTGADTSRIQLGAGTLTVASPAQTVNTFAGIINGSGGVIHNGPGQWILRGQHQYLGPTRVTSGTLQIDALLTAASQVVVGGTGVLTGAGNVGAVSGVSGRFRPGRDDGIGLFSTDALNFSAGHTVDIVLRPYSGTRIGTSGLVSLGGATLALRKVDGVQIDTPLVLIANEGTDAVVGTFAGLPEGSIATAGDQQFRISYAGGTGNDVVITPTELTYFLSEGSTGAFFDTEIAIANPNPAIVPVTVEFLVEGGGQVITRNYELAPMSRMNILVDEIAGLESAAVSTKVRSTNATPIVVERTMWWGGEARYGAHTEKASSGVAQRWYFAEGSQGFFFTFLLLANPINQNNEATVRFLLEGGGEVVKTYPLAPLSRQTVSAGDVPELVGRSFGMEVTFAHGGVAERAMYFGTNPFWTAGHESAGVPAPSTKWFLAEGATGPFFETFILLANPNAAAANATVRFLPASGPAIVKQVEVPASGRLTINIEPQDESVANVPVATEVSSPIPIVVERAQYWPDPAPQWYEAHNSFGVTETWPKWGLAEGRVGGATGYQTYILLANPTANAATVTITFLREAGTPIVKQFTVNPASRFNVSIGSGPDVPELTNERFGALIESNVDIVVERALYANSGAQVWGAGTNATATRLP